MADILMNLKTFQYGGGVGTNEEPLMHLGSHAKGLTVNACAHALFFYKLLQTTRQNNETDNDTSKDSPNLKIGIIGGGHLGKQLTRVLLELSGISGQDIQISTRQPETLLEFQVLGVESFYNNRQLVNWADVVFLCCLPSHLPHICSEVQDVIKEHTIIYSLVTAVPLPRLKQLLSCSAILRPQYTFADRAQVNIWETRRTVVAALKDHAVLQATDPYSPKGAIAINTRWLEAIFYAVLNSYSWQHIPHMKALELLNKTCFSKNVTIISVEETLELPLFLCKNFVGEAVASSLTPDNTFPYFDLTTVQLNESPLSQLLARNIFLQKNIASLYFNMMSTLPANNEESMEVTMKKIPLSAVLLNPTKALNRALSTSETDAIGNVEDESSTDSEETDNENSEIPNL